MQAQLSRLINNCKTVTSCLNRQEFTEELKPYFISSVSDLSKDVIREYIQKQGKKGSANPA